MAGERWRREGASEGVEGVTLVVTHANGFHKEVSSAAWVLDSSMARPAEAIELASYSAETARSRSVRPVRYLRRALAQANISRSLIFEEAASGRNLAL
jgi:hypothetical protein